MELRSGEKKIEGDQAMPDKCRHGLKYRQGQGEQDFDRYQSLIPYEMRIEYRRPAAASQFAPLRSTRQRDAEAARRKLRHADSGLSAELAPHLNDTAGTVVGQNSSQQNLPKDASSVHAG